jgi:TonB family protein
MVGRGTARSERVRVPLVAGCVLSLAVHALLFAASGGALDIDGPHAASSTLDVVLATAPRLAEEAVMTSPAALRPLAPERPRYAPMLPFAPAIVPLPSFDEASYLPASRLTKEPMPIDEIEVRYPRGVHHLRVLTVALTLFIDENGRVENIRIDEPVLPEPYERAAIEAFAQGKFHPGFDGDRAVKSRLRIRVAFDSGDSGETALAPLLRPLS